MPMTTTTPARKTLTPPEASAARLLGTDRKTGTSPESLIEGAEALGLVAEARSGMTVEDLAAAVESYRPAICAVQMTGDGTGDRAGHYVVVAEVTPTSVIVQDPARGRVRIGRKLWERRWHDVGADGTEYVRWGVVLGKPEGGKAASVPVAKASFFSECDRDDAGRCKPGTGGKKPVGDKPAAAGKPSGSKPKPASKPKPKPKPTERASEAARKLLDEIRSQKPSEEEQRRYEERERQTQEVLRKTQELLDSMKPRIDNEVAKPLGERGQQAYETLRSALHNSPDLNEEQTKEYSDGLRKVAGRIPEAGHERILQNLGATQFYPDPTALAEGMWQKTVGEAKPPKLGWFTRFSLWLFSTREDKELADLQMEVLHKEFVLTHQCAGAYNRRDRSLVLDGAYHMPSGMGRKFDSVTAPMVHAHELGHVIDGPDLEYSNSRGWLDAYAAEIDRDDEPLTEYARTKTFEGFAEFSRLLYGGGVDLAEVEKTFPRCSAFFKEKGLWPPPS